MTRSMTTAEAGRLGGLRSRRQLSAESARAVVGVREARKLFRTHYVTCFWWANPDLVIGAKTYNGSPKAFASTADARRGARPRGSSA